MKRHIDFGSIEQFRTVVQSVSHTTRFQGLDEQGQPIFDGTLPLPVVTAVGAEKIHGANAAVCYSIPDGFWVQSHSNIITPTQDNAGCAFAAMANQTHWMNIIETLADKHDIDLNTKIISVYYEWCGGNIQKNACVSGEEKMSIIFRHFKVSPLEQSETEKAVWHETNGIDNSEQRIFNVDNFPKVELTIDFNDPVPAMDAMSELVARVENQSGIAKHFNRETNVGEGWVFSFVDSSGNLLRWKAKGEKHQATKVKKMKVDDPREADKIEFAQYAVTAGRCEQAWNEIFGVDNEKQQPSEKATGQFIKWVLSDIIKEELDVLTQRELEPKAVNGYISKIARDWFFEQMDIINGIKK